MIINNDSNLTKHARFIITYITEKKNIKTTARPITIKLLHFKSHLAVQLHILVGKSLSLVSPDILTTTHTADLE